MENFNPLYLLPLIAGGIGGLWVMAMRFSSQNRVDTRCPYCSKGILESALVCPHCNGSLGIGSFWAIREALERNPLLSGNDMASKIELKALVETIEKESLDQFTPMELRDQGWFERNLYLLFFIGFALLIALASIFS